MDIRGHLDFERAPNLFLVGAPKCATTALVENLGRSGEIFVPEMKEPHFLATAYPPPRLKLVHHVTARRQYQSMYESAGDSAWRIDGSTSYFHSADACDAIRMKKGTRAILVLRDPVKRYFSHYRNDLRECFESRSISKVVGLENGTDFEAYGYFASGLYADFLELWHRSLGNERLLVIDFDALTREPQRTLPKVYEFLGLTDRPAAVLSHENAAGAPPNAVIRTIMRSSWLRPMLKVVPKGIRKNLRSRLLSGGGEAGTFDDETVQCRIRSLYKEDMGKLADVITKTNSIGSFEFIKKNHQ